MKNNFYSSISRLDCIASCVGITQAEWDQYMSGAKRADKRKVNALVKKHLPDLYADLCLDYRNPYNYYKNDRFIILTHSAIEYFIEYN